MRDYPDFGKEALKFAEEQLKVAKIPTTYNPWSASRFRHVAPTKITQLNYLLWEVYYPKLLTTLKQYEAQGLLAWERQEVVLEADHSMKIAYAISCQNLEQLKRFTENVKDSPEWLSPISYSLTRQDSYQFRTFFCAPRIYCVIRGSYMLTKDHYSTEYLEDPTRISEIFKTALKKRGNYTQLFYTLGAIQNRWNILYNDYCDRVRMYVTEDEMKEFGGRHLNWTIKDTSFKKFKATPDTLPT